MNYRPLAKGLMKEHEPRSLPTAIADALEARAKSAEFVFSNQKDLEEYLDWKHEVPEKLLFCCRRFC